MSVFGITTVTGTLIESVSVSEKADVAVIYNSDGTYGQANAYDRKQTFSVKGRGTTAIIPGALSFGAPDQLDGKILVTSVKLTETNTEYNAFEYSGEAYPYAT